MSFLATLATVVGLLVPVVVGVSWLLQKAFGHQKELVIAWHNSTNEKIVQLFSEVNKLVVKVSAVERDNHTQMVDLKATAKKVDQVLEDLRDTKRELSDKIVHVERSSVTWLNDQLALIRAKKGK
jgi:hypothetical protein